MKEKAFRRFKGKYVKIDRLLPGSVRSFKLYGTAKDVEEDCLIFFTDHISAIPLEQIVGIEDLDNDRRG